MYVFMLSLFFLAALQRNTVLLVKLREIWAPHWPDVVLELLKPQDCESHDGQELRLSSWTVRFTREDKNTHTHTLEHLCIMLLCECFFHTVKQWEVWLASTSELRMRWRREGAGLLWGFAFFWMNPTKQLPFTTNLKTNSTYTYYSVTQNIFFRKPSQKCRECPSGYTHLHSAWQFCGCFLFFLFQKVSVCHLKSIWDAVKPACSCNDLGKN